MNYIFGVTAAQEIQVHYCNINLRVEKIKFLLFIFSRVSFIFVVNL